MTDGSSLRPIASACMLATVTAHHHRPLAAHRRRSSVARRHCPSPLLLQPSRPRPSRSSAAHHRRRQPAPAIPLPLVTMSPLIAHLQPSVTDHHRWSEARRHRQSPLACSCRPITARHCCSVARRHCPSPPACHYLPPHHHPHDTVCHLYHLDGDAELHTGGLTCCRPPTASSAAYL